MEISKNINFVRDLLDTALDLQLIYIENLKNNIYNLEESLPTILTVNKNYFNSFIDFMLQANENIIYYISNSIFANYTLICTDEKEKNYLLIGPYIERNLSDDFFNSIDKYNLSTDEIVLLRNYYTSIPVINMTKILGISDMIVNNIYGSDVKFKLVPKNNIDSFIYKDKSYINNSTSFISTVDSEIIEKNYKTEYKLLISIKNGDKISSSRYLDKLWIFFKNTEESSNIRLVKNKVIYYNTLFRKYAQLGGGPIVYLDNLFNLYSSNIESLNSFDELENLLFYILMNYCTVVKNYSLKDFSPLVSNTMNYINLNLRGSLTVKGIADLFFVSPSYLTRLFKKENNCSVIEYINRQRIDRATYLLKDTDLAIQDISHLVGIEDVNYFSRLFKKYIKKTPTQYRKYS